MGESAEEAIQGEMICCGSLGLNLSHHSGILVSRIRTHPDTYGKSSIEE